MINIFQSLIRNNITPSTFQSCSWRIQKCLPNNSIILSQIRYMSKYISKSAKKRLNLTTKRARKGFYKGKGSTKEGHISSIARFIVDPLRRLELIIPSLEGFKLKPYIASAASKYPKTPKVQ